MASKLLKTILGLFSRTKEVDAAASETLNISVPSRWTQLTMDQLLRLHTLTPVDEDASTYYRLSQFLILICCDIVGWDYRVEGKSLPTYINDTLVNADNESISTALDAMEACMRGNNQTITLRKIEGSSSEPGSTMAIYNVDKDDFFGAVIECTKWLEEKELSLQLVRLPDDDIRIKDDAGNSEVFHLPEFMMQNITYQQYTTAQQFMEAFWKTSESISKMTDKSNLEILANRLTTYQRNFIACLLHSTKTEVRKVEQEDAEGKRHIKEHEVRTSKPYSEEEHERIKEVMKGAPAGLFLILLRYYQSCNNTFKQWYPQLFKEVSDDSGEVKGNIIVAEQGTHLMLVQEGYFPSVEAVMKANVGYVLKALNTMNEKAEMTRDAMRSARK